MNEYERMNCEGGKVSVPSKSLGKKYGPISKKVKVKDDHAMSRKVVSTPLLYECNMPTLGLREESTK
jgi:hypothetical protein